MALGILKKTLENQSAQIIIVEIGGNDALRGIALTHLPKTCWKLNNWQKPKTRHWLYWEFAYHPTSESYRQAHSEVYAGMLKYLGPMSLWTMSLPMTFFKLIAYTRIQPHKYIY